MFQQNPNDSKSDSGKTPSPFLKDAPKNNSDLKNNPQPENVMIHSMAKDLKEADRGFSGADLKNVVKPAPIKKEASPFSPVKVSNENNAPKAVLNNQPNKQKEKKYDFSFSANKEENVPKKPENKGFSNALLNQDSWQKKNNLSKKEDIYVKGDKESGAEKKEEKKEEHHGFGKAITFAVILSVVLIAGARGYYFWMTRMGGEENPPVANNPIDTPNNNVPEDPMPVLPSFSTDSPNYLKMDFAKIDEAGAKNSLKEYRDKVYESKLAVPVEFILTDNENNPISFSDFAEKSGIDLSQNILTNLEDSFSIYIYIDNNMPRVGMEVELKEETSFQKALPAEEKNLVSGLSLLFLDLPYLESEAVAFKSSKYMENDIRYFNIPSTENLSVDYSISEGQWIIGTSQMTLHAILDSINQKELEKTEEAVSQEEITDQEIEVDEVLGSEE